MHSPDTPDHDQDVASKNPESPDGPTEDTRNAGNGLREAHQKACDLVKRADEDPLLEDKLSKDWVRKKLALINDNLAAIHDFIVNDKEATDSEHGDDGGDGGDVGGGFIISIERALSK